MSFCLIRMSQREDGWGPNLPEGVGFGLLAEPAAGSERSPFGLYEVSAEWEGRPSDAIEFVSEELHELLQSAKDYPPALAISQHQIRAEQTRSKEEFVRAFSRLLRNHLAAQSTCAYFMAMATRDEAGYRTAGGFYWIVGYNRDRNTVAWVSRDFQIYNDDRSNFDVTEEELQARFENSYG